jgi:hypothetical protein
MDFIVGLTHTRASYDSIWVVVDRLTKAAHFIPVQTTYNSVVLVVLYMTRIVCLHGVPKKIVSNRGTQFTSHTTTLVTFCDVLFMLPNFEFMSIFEIYDISVTKIALSPIMRGIASSLTFHVFPS